MKRTVNVATFHYPGFDALEAHERVIVTACKLARILRALRWRTPLKTICDARTRAPDPFKIDPHHLIPGLHT